MSLPAADNFNRANEARMSEAVGTNWAQISDLDYMQLYSNAVKQVASDAGVYWKTDAYNAAHWSECIIPTSNDGGPAVRCSASGCYYLGGASGANAIWRYKTGGNWMQIGTALNFSHNATDVIRLEATGTTTTSLKVYKNGAQQGTTKTDSSSPLTSGSAGLYAAGTTVLDNFNSNNVTVAFTGKVITCVFGVLAMLRARLRLIERFDDVPQGVME